jgi:hypothetical protein
MNGSDIGVFRKDLVMRKMKNLFLLGGLALAGGAGCISYQPHKELVDHVKDIIKKPETVIKETKKRVEKINDKDVVYNVGMEAAYKLLGEVETIKYFTFHINTTKKSEIQESDLKVVGLDSQNKEITWANKFLKYKGYYYVDTTFPLLIGIEKFSELRALDIDGMLNKPTYWYYNSKYFTVPEKYDKDHDVYTKL